MNLGTLAAWLRRRHHLALEREEIQRVSQLSVDEYAIEQILSPRQIEAFQSICQDRHSSNSEKAEAERVLKMHEAGLILQQAKSERLSIT